VETFIKIHLPREVLLRANRQPTNGKTRRKYRPKALNCYCETRLKICN